MKRNPADKIVVVILLLLASSVVYRAVDDRLYAWRIGKEKERGNVLASITSGLEYYHQVNGRFPDELDDLFGPCFYESSRKELLDHPPKDRIPLYVKLPHEGIVYVALSGKNGRIDTDVAALRALSLEEVRNLWTGRNRFRENEIYGDDVVDFVFIPEQLAYDFPITATGESTNP